MSYATDGLCHNANPGTYGHECGKPAMWIGTAPCTVRPGTTYESGYCDRCKRNGWEARNVTSWEPIKVSTLTPAELRAAEMVSLFGKVSALYHCQERIVASGDMGIRFYWQTVHTYIDPTISAAPAKGPGSLSTVEGR